MPDRPENRVFYAIGDVHGEAKLLADLHQQVFNHHELFGGGARAVLVHLGDYIDRGPDSYGVVERLMGLEARPPEGWEVFSLLGNHEEMAISAFDRGAHDYTFWSENGGAATEISYRDHGFDGLAPGHMKWLKGLPRMLWFEDERLILVHAGVCPRRFPEESEDIRIWTRSARFFDTGQWTSPALEGQRVVHGHTPTDDQTPDVSPDGRRINVDTGAVFGGPLSAVVLATDAEPEFLSAYRQP